jgi:hypothetical protein
LTGHVVADKYTEIWWDVAVERSHLEGLGRCYKIKNYFCAEFSTAQIRRKHSTEAINLLKKNLFILTKAYIFSHGVTALSGQSLLG